MDTKNSTINLMAAPNKLIIGVDLANDAPYQPVIAVMVIAKGIPVVAAATRLKVENPDEMDAQIKYIAKLFGIPIVDKPFELINKLKKDHQP